MSLETDSRTGRIKADVRAFYDRLGWSERCDACFEDAARFEDLRPVSAEYLRHCHRRVGRHLEGGALLLDAASGPIQFDEYLEYGAAFARRVCVDLSLVALRRARQRLGTRGLYVVADITRLPFRADAFDGVISISTIYHVPANEQETAFLELHRVLQSGRRGVVVYSWGRHARLMVAFDALPAKLAAMWRARHTHASGSNGGGEPALYFHTFGPGWMARHVGGAIPIEIRVWRALSVPFMRRFIPDHRLGRVFLRWIVAFEERFPHFAGTWGQYPLIVIHKAVPGRIPT